MKLQISILEAENLVSGTDSFVQLQLEKEKKKTKIVKKTENPHWNETFNFSNPTQDSTLLFDSLFLNLFRIEWMDNNSSTLSSTEYSLKELNQMEMKREW
jgi:Ca2+-dependent lipid-binding protein